MASMMALLIALMDHRGNGADQALDLPEGVSSVDSGMCAPSSVLRARTQQNEDQDSTKSG